jgi:hypothetical protein
VSGIALDQDDVRAHGKDERVRVSSFYDGVEFYYRYLKALTGARRPAGRYSRLGVHPKVFLNAAM